MVYTPLRILTRRPTSSCSRPVTMIVSQGTVTDFPSHKHRLDWFGSHLESPLVDTDIGKNLIQHAVAIVHYAPYILYPSDVSLASDEAY